MNREETIQTIVRAAQWLTTSPQTHSGYATGACYVVKVSAKTLDFQVHTKGVYFGSESQFLQNGNFDGQSSLVLIDHADHTSWRDRIPFTYAPQTPDPRLGVGDHLGIDMRLLCSFSNEQLDRMAKNALRILQDYGQV